MSLVRALRLFLHLAIFSLIAYKSIPVVQNLLSQRYYYGRKDAVVTLRLVDEGDMMCLYVCVCM